MCRSGFTSINTAPSLYGQLSDRIGRACQRLGLKRVPREIVPDLASMLSYRTDIRAMRRAMRCCA